MVKRDVQKLPMVVDQVLSFFVDGLSLFVLRPLLRPFLSRFFVFFLPDYGRAFTSLFYPSVPNIGCFFLILLARPYALFCYPSVLAGNPGLFVFWAAVRCL